MALPVSLGLGILKFRLYSSRWAGVYLSMVRTHNGVRYYARMAVEFFVSGQARWVAGWFGIHGGTVPCWGFPAVFPYL